jgi:adsorption protein A
MRRRFSQVIGLPALLLVLWQPMPGQAFPNLLRDWKRFSAYPHLARGSQALQQGRFSEAEREARHVLNRIDATSRDARVLLAQALLAQRRHGPALDALQPLPGAALRRQIQLSWLNQPSPTPAWRVEQWLRQSGSAKERDALATAHAEQLRRQFGAAAAWRWLRSRGGDITYRSGLAELARDWRSVVAELSPLAGMGRGLSPLLAKRLALARATLNPPAFVAPPQAKGAVAVWRIPPEPAPTLDQLSYRLIAAGSLFEALTLLEQRLGLSPGQAASAPIEEPLASRLVNLYGQVRPPAAHCVERLAPRLSSSLRGQLYEQLVDQGLCDRIPALSRDATRAASAGEWLARGECSITQRPGEAVIYLERALEQGRSDGRSLLAFALAASGEPERAYQLWSELPPSERQNTAVQAGMAQVALELERPDQAEAHWLELRAPDRDQWRLGGLIAQARGDLKAARERFEQVLATSQDGADFYQAGLIARTQGDRAQARRWLQKATELSPGNGAYLSDYGFTLSQDPDRRIRDQAVPVLLEASRINPSNPALELELANRTREQGQRSASLQHLGRAIELEQDPAIATEPLETPAQRQRIYGLKRSYESLARNNSWLINLTVAPDGAAQTVNEALISANNNVVGTAIYEHRLPVEGLFGYGRLISANDALNNQNQTAGGLGVRYAPIRGVNMNVFTEAYQAQLGQPNTSDLLLRINGSLLDQGRWNAEWKEDRRAWNERSLYLDAAWFVNQNQTLSLARYSQGRTWRVGQGLAQTLSPYLLGQFSQQNSQTDLRIGLGLRWQLWLQQDRLRAYRRKITARAELQQSLAGDLYRNGTGVVLSLQADL